MSVFISWSGTNSATVGEAFHQLMRHVLQGLPVFISSDKIRSGSLWFPEIQGGLEVAKVGVVVATPEAVRSPWVLFETGAIWKAKPQIDIGVLRVGLSAEHLRDHPLGQFQSRDTSKSEVLRLLQDIGVACGHRVDRDVMERAFEQNWSAFETTVSTLPAEDAAAVPARQSEDESLEKIANRLTTVERFILSRADTDQRLLALLDTALRPRPIVNALTIPPQSERIGGGLGMFGQGRARLGLFDAGLAAPLVSGQSISPSQTPPDTQGKAGLKAKGKKAGDTPKD